MPPRFIATRPHPSYDRKTLGDPPFPKPVWGSAGGGRGVALGKGHMDTRTPDEIRSEIKRISALVIRLSAKAEDLSQALATVTERKRRLSLELLKLEAELKQAGEVSG